MDEIITRAECYIKGEESNAEKKARDLKEHNTNNLERKNYYPSTTRDRTTFKRQDRRPYTPHEVRTQFDNFTPMNTLPERILREVYNTRLILEAQFPKGPTMGNDRNSWCKYHKVKGHDNDSCVHLRQEIEKLLQTGKLQGYAEESRSEDRKKDERDQTTRKEGQEEVRKDSHTLHTISGGFYGGGESSSSQKRYV